MTKRLPVALLACETGTGRGHVATLAGVELALAGRYTCVAGLSRLEYASVLALHCREVVQAPVMARRPDAEVIAARRHFRKERNDDLDQAIADGDRHVVASGLPDNDRRHPRNRGRTTKCSQ